MKAYKITLILSALFFTLSTQAQKYKYNNSATVVAQNYDISDNLDLKAVASIFGDSRDLEDFERRLNDPSAQISNLDLNRDNIVDYLRVIEVADNDARVIVIQSVLGEDLFQDVATIELERESRAVATSSSSNINIQIVGNPYLYGANYIYEPFYSVRPLFFDMFWGVGYRPYYSPWYWGYYPTYYSYWAPMPIHRYRNHIYPVINTRNRYVYSDTRRISRADRMYSSVSRRGFEQTNPNRSFSQRNNNVSNRYSLDTNRSAGRDAFNTRTNAVRNVNNESRATDSRVSTSDRATSRNFSTGDRSVNVRSNSSEVRATNDRSSSLRVEVPQNNRIERAQRPTTTTNQRVNTSNEQFRNTRATSSDSFSRSSNSGSFSRSSSSSPSMRSSAPSMSRSSSSMPSSSSRSGGSQRSGR